MLKDAKSQWNPWKCSFSGKHIYIHIHMCILYIWKNHLYIGIFQQAKSSREYLLCSSWKWGHCPTYDFGSMGYEREISNYLIRKWFSRHWSPLKIRLWIPGVCWGPRFLAKNFKLVPKHHQTITKYLKVGSAKILPNQGPSPKNCLKTSNTMLCKQSFLNIPLVFGIFWHEFEVFRGSGGPIRSQFEVSEVKPEIFHTFRYIYIYICIHMCIYIFI